MRITNERLNEVTELLEGALDGDARAQGQIKYEIKSAMTDAEESHSTSDFPAAFKSITQAAFLESYGQIESVWTQFARPYNVNNLRPQSFYSLAFDGSNLPDQNGGEPTIKRSPGGIPRVPELTEFAPISFTASESSFGVAKYGARVNFSFEMLLNDEWGVLETLPTQLAQLARNQEDIVASEVLVNPVAPYGPNPDFFSVANGNVLTTAGGFSSNNPVLSIDAVANALSAVRSRTFNGNPVVAPQLALMVPPALEAQARKLLGITTLQVTDPVNGVYDVTNPISGVSLIVNPWLPVLDLSATVNTTWYIVPVAGAGIRPSIVFSKIRGRETPELRIATEGGEYLGGGSVPGREGSFLNDDIQFRVRHFMGAAGIAYETTAVSKGTGAA